MIIKHFNLNKIELTKNKFVLFYGKNDGLKKESLNMLLKKFNNVSFFEEKEILDNSKHFIENLLSGSLFEDQKIISIKRTTDKILKIIDEVIIRNIEDIIIILDAENLEKKSKLRLFFEKNKQYVCVPFYPDNAQSLSKLSFDYFRNKNIQISQSSINLIINKSNGDRGVLFNELKKIELYCLNRTKVTEGEIAKLVNLAEDHDISYLIDNCLAKNEKKTMNILNENNFTNEDCILISRIFLNKAKKILKLSNEFEKNKDMELTINSAKPPIFWKDKEITKQQIYKWKPKNVKKLIYKLNEIELNIKKNLNNSINLISDFVLEQSSNKTNN